MKNKSGMKQNNLRWRGNSSGYIKTVAKTMQNVK